jgi:hypothetical protein
MSKWLRTVGPNRQATTINRLFNQIRDGKFKNSKASTANEARFIQLYGDQGIAFQKFGTLLTEIYQPSLYTKVIEQLTAQMLAMVDIDVLFTSNTTLINEMFEEQRQYLSDTISQLDNLIDDSEDTDEMTEYQEMQNFFKEIHDNYDNVFKLSIVAELNRLKLVTLGKNIKESLAVNSQDEAPESIWDKAAYEFDPADKASKMIQILFTTLRKSDTVDKSTNYLPDTITFREAWNQALRVLHSARNPEEMMHRIIAEGENQVAISESNGRIQPFNMWTDLYDKLSKGSEKLKSQLFDSLHMHQYHFTNFFFGEDEENGGLTVRFTDADITKRSKRIVTRWSRKWGLDEGWKDVAKIKATVAEFKALHSTTIGDINVDDTLDRLVKIFNSIGIELDRATLIQAAYNFEGTTTADRIHKLLHDTDVSGIYTSKYSIVGGMDALEKMAGQQSYTYGGRNLSPLDYLQSLKFVKQFAEDFVKQHPVADDSSIVGVENTTVYGFAEGTFLTESLTEYLHDPEYIANLQGEVGNRRSWLIKQLSDPAFKNNVGIQTLLGTFEDGIGDRGRKYLDISDVEDILMKIAAINNNLLTIPTQANKQQYHVLTGFKKIPVSIKLNRSTGTFTLDSTTVRQFTEYFLAEYEAIQGAVEARAKFLRTVFGDDLSGMTIAQAVQKFDNMTESEQNRYDYSMLVENYHYKYDNKKNYGMDKDGYVYSKRIKLADGNRYKFIYFSDFNEALAKNDTTIFRSFNDDNDQRNHYNLVIAPMIQKHITRNVNETLLMLHDMGVIELHTTNLFNPETSIGTYLDKDDTIKSAIKANILLDGRTLNNMRWQAGMMTGNVGKQVVDDPNNIAIMSMVADYAINTAMTTIYFDKLIHGDVAYYKNPVDRIKRYSALASSGKVGRLLWPQGHWLHNVDTYKQLTLRTNNNKAYTTYKQLLHRYVGTLAEPGSLLKTYLAHRAYANTPIQARDESFDPLLYQNIKDMTDAQLFDYVNKQAVTKLQGYINNDQTDGYVMMSPVMFRAIEEMHGRWDDNKTNAYDLLMSDKASLSLDEELEAYNTVVMQPKKMMYFGKEFVNDLGIPIYDKPAYFTIFPRMAKGTDLQSVTDFWSNNNTDKDGRQQFWTVAFESASKVGNRQSTRLYNVTGDLETLSIEDQTRNTRTREFKYLREQLNTDPHDEHELTFGTQVTKVSIFGAISNKLYNVGNDRLTGDEVRQQWSDIIKELSNRGAKRIISEFGITEQDDGTLLLNKQRFMAILRKDAQQSGTTDNVISSLVTDDNGNYVVHPSAMPTITWMQSRLLAMLKSEVIDIENNGGAFIQMSNIGLKDSGKQVNVLKLNNESLRDYSYKQNGELRFINDDNAYQAIISINLFKHLIPNYKNIGYEAAVEWLMKQDLNKLLAYRIPTQGQNSIAAIKIVGVLPETYGDTIILPSEWTSLTGSD